MLSYILVRLRLQYDTFQFSEINKLQTTIFSEILFHYNGRAYNKEDEEI